MGGIHFIPVTGLPGAGKTSQHLTDFLSRGCRAAERFTFRNIDKAYKKNVFCARNRARRIDRRVLFAAIDDGDKDFLKESIFQGGLHIPSHGSSVKKRFNISRINTFPGKLPAYTCAHSKYRIEGKMIHHSVGQLNRVSVWREVRDVGASEAS